MPDKSQRQKPIIPLANFRSTDPNGDETLLRATLNRGSPSPESRFSVYLELTADAIRDHDFDETEEYP